MSTARRRFSVSAPDWGASHLSPEAVVAFVDDELASRPHVRAQAHVAACPECAGEVERQRQARAALRGAGDPALPSSLLSSLRSIPQRAELPGDGLELAVTEGGEIVSVLRGAGTPGRGVFGGPVLDTGDLPTASGSRRFGSRGLR